MLKIKDNVDLKELEAYGFEINKYWDNSYMTIMYEGRRGQEFDLIINENRFIQGWSEGADGDGTQDYISNVLYDLIKADLVEKVEE